MTDSNETNDDAFGAALREEVRAAAQDFFADKDAKACPFLKFGEVIDDSDPDCPVHEGRRIFNIVKDDRGLLFSAYEGCEGYLDDTKAVRLNAGRYTCGAWRRAMLHSYLDAWLDKVQRVAGETT